MPVAHPVPIPVRQWGPQSCEAACAAEILRRAGLLDEPFDPAAFDRRIGRQPGEPDLTMGGMAMLVRSGFEVRAYVDFDINRALKDREYVAGLWLAGGSTAEVIEEELPHAYPQLCRRWAAQLEIEGWAGDRCVRICATADAATITALLEDGWVILIEEINPDGSSHACLLDRQANGSAARAYECYDPAGAEHDLLLTADDLAQLMDQGHFEPSIVARRQAGPR